MKTVEIIELLDKDANKYGGTTGKERELNLSINGDFVGSIESAKLDGCIERGKYHEQLVKWLEDYKQIKMLVPIEQALKTEYNKGYSKAENDYHAQSEKDRQSSYDCGYEAGYSKAIDVACEYLKCEWAVDNLQTCDDFDRIAERLKAG